ncbi:TPA: hypothetical protein O9509_002486 [Staphylococcus aureus]|uniref:hypothetical protein n=1 Tax=Staphylococcus aureus TaxID=1280 RepID=UPI000E04E9C4|nr:hypothetical protein [Staphylococcus aureus]SUJ45918.1 Putative cytosolic protein [Staphylococcus aureus]SUJ92210.1 Putative cytosolic protein [Staphylococcus aureus]SUK04239.1 Putative cytosolic protein [Staphylococcus aureus]HDD0210209.1 hypothetical protein [Staphylococcus aureus]HDD0305299.1 hypothetical protein [Staphylococcus aureus]
MMFNRISNKKELEESYEFEKKRIENELQNLNELRHRTRKENEHSYDVFQYLKHEMNYSEDAQRKMTRNIEAYEQEINEIVRKQEWKLEEYKVDLKKSYEKQLDKLSDY